MPFNKELSHLIEEQISQALAGNTSAGASSGLGMPTDFGTDMKRLSVLEANLQRLADQFAAFLAAQKKSKINGVDYGLEVVALHDMRLAVTAGRAEFSDQAEPLDVPFTYLELSGSGPDRQIRYIYLSSAGLIQESTTDPTNIGTGYIPLALIDVWANTTEITQDRITDIRPLTGGSSGGSQTASAQSQLTGNVTLSSPDTGSDSFIVSATNPAGLKVNVTSGRALVDGEVLDAQGGTLDLTNHRSVVKEFLALSDGVATTYRLYHQGVTNVYVYADDVLTTATVDAASGTVTLAAAPAEGAVVTASYTFGGNYMVVFLVKKTQTSDGKSYGVIDFECGSNRDSTQPPELTSYQHAIAKVDMSDAITVITDDIIDNSYEVTNLTQQALQYGGNLGGASLASGSVTGDKIAVGSVNAAHISLDEAVPEVSNIMINEIYYRQKDGTIVSYLEGNCTLPDYDYFRYANIRYSEDNGGSWVSSGTTTDGKFVISGIKTGVTYLIKIRVVNTVGNLSLGVVSAPILVTGKDNPPQDVAALAAQQDPLDATKINLSWPAVTDIDLKGYELRLGSVWDTAVPINSIVYGTKQTYSADHSGLFSFLIKAIDNSGNYSVTARSISINAVIEPAGVANFTVYQLASDRSKVKMSWSPNQETDLSYYEIRCGAAWDSADVVATQLKATAFEYKLPGEGSYTFLLKAVNAASKYSIDAAQVTQTYIIKPNAPGSGTITQDPNDRTALLVSWLPTPDEDLLQYEVRLGTDWDAAILVNTTKETLVRYKIGTSGSYNFMVRTKNVAGYLSSALNLSITASVEAPDVTGFTASQSVTDHTQVRLSWDQPTALDIAYFEIRQGAAWDTCTIIDQRVTGTFYDVTVTEETPQTFWIKAVNVGGKYSLFPASVMGVYNLNPSMPANLTVIQNPDDRSQLIITWDGVLDLDLLEYELRVGYTWDNAATVVKTKELSAVYKPPASGDYKFILKAKNNANFYSDEAFTNIYATLEPSDVTGFYAVQNGGSVLFGWQKSSDPDVVSYELREGSTFDNGSLIATGITQISYQTAVDTEREYRFHIKALNRAGRISQNAAVATVAVLGLPPKNIIQTYDEITLQSGTHTNTEFGASFYNFSDLGGSFCDYPTLRFDEVGGGTVLKLEPNCTTGEYLTACKDVSQVITANITCEFMSTVLLSSGISAKLQYRISQDNVNWSDWQDFRPGVVTFRYVEFKVLLATQDSAKTPEVNQFKITIDVPDTDKYGTATIAPGGTDVPYNYTYFSPPVVLPTAIGSGLRAELISRDTAAFRVKVLSVSDNADVGGEIIWMAKGY